MDAKPAGIMRKHAKTKTDLVGNPDDQFSHNEAHFTFTFEHGFSLHWALQNQRTNGPVNAHLISWPSKAQNIQNLENIW